MHKKALVALVLPLAAFLLIGCTNLRKGTDYTVVDSTLVNRNNVADMYTEARITSAGLALRAEQLRLMVVNDNSRYTNCETKYALAHEAPQWGNISGTVRPNRNLVICWADDNRDSRWDFDANASTSDAPMERQWSAYMGGQDADRVGGLHTGPLANDMDAANPPNPGPPPSPLSQWRNTEAEIRQLGDLLDRPASGQCMSLRVDRITYTLRVAC